MRAHGNGNLSVCAGNLLRIYRGEVPYERAKGLNPRLFDKPTSTVIPEVQRDARWLLETYEPRAVIESITVSQGEGVAGDLIITAKIQGEGEVSNG